MYFGFDSITVDYGRNRILDQLTLEIPRGKIVTLIGQNGCGKTTLLKTVSRAVTPKTGQVICEDRPLRSYAPKILAQKIAYLAQVHESPPDMDVRTLVSCGRYPYLKFGRSQSAADRESIDRAIALTGLEALQSRPLAALSGGERQRAWIAMTVAQEPEILILDEPTAYLDIRYQVELLELVRRLNRELGITVLTVLHELNLAARYSDRLCVIHNKRLYAEGTPAEILTADSLREIFGISARVMYDADNGCPFFIPLESVNGKGSDT